jgi:predicted flap endonuclease-1-like 5' DNA nuclease
MIHASDQAVHVYAFLLYLGFFFGKRLGNWGLSLIINCISKIQIQLNIEEEDMSADTLFTLTCAAFIASLFGLALTFTGYKLFRILLPIWGFFFGLLLGAQTVQVLFNEGFLTTVTSWLVGLIVGVIFAVFAFPFYLFAVAIIASSLGYFAAVGLLLWLGMKWGLLVWLIGIVAAIAVAAVTLIFNLQKWVIIIATSILGAGLIVAVLTALFKPVSLLLENPVRVMLQTSPLLLIVFLLLVIFGIIVQSRTTRSVAVVEPVTPTKASVVPETVAGEATPAAAVAGAAGITAVAEAARQEPAPVESAAGIMAAQTPIEQPAPAKGGEVNLAAEVAASESKVAPISAEEIDKFKYSLEYIEGIGPVYAAKLNAIGIANLHDLLEKGAFPKGREEMAQAAGISHTLVLKWVNHVDLYRIKGVGSEYADLLEVAGVDTVVELALRNPDNLYAKLVSVNEEKKLVRRVPVLNQVQDWVEQAKTLPRKINY